jgi:hypothetical protein
MYAIDVTRLRPANDRDAATARAGKLLSESPGGELAALNGVSVPAPAMRAAIDAIQHIQIKCDAGAIQHAEILIELADDMGLEPEAHAASALHARAIALDRWCERHDPYGQTDIEALFQAAARCPLIEYENGLAFDPETFRDLMSVIIELPF